MRSKRRRRGPESERECERRNTEFAWRVHNAQESWASNADLKASILIALEGGALYAIISALGGGGVLSHVSDWLGHLAENLGIFALLLAILCAVAAIFPRLGQKNKTWDSQRRGIYFGVLRHWSPAEFTDYLTGLTEQQELDALGHQVTVMSRHNWAKHRWIQISL